MNDADHDLLIRIDTKLDIYTTAQTTFRQTVETQLKEVWGAIDGLRAERNQAKGFIAGGKALWMLLAGIPPTVLAVIFGLGNN